MMNRIGFANDLLSEEDIRKMSLVDNCVGCTFIELSKILDLDPNLDFRYVDLRGIDLSNCDIRGFDFTGSDLSGATGVNVRWDPSTILANADLSNSLFANAFDANHAIDTSHELQREYARIRRADWSEQVLWTMDTALINTKNVDDLQLLAMNLYFDTNQPIVRSTIVQSLVFSEKNIGRSIDFFLRILSDFRTDEKSLAFSIKVFGKYFSHRPEIINPLFNIAESENAPLSIREEAMKSILNNKHSMSNINRIKSIFRIFYNIELEELLVKAVAKRLSNDHYLAITRGLAHASLNFQEEINGNTIYEISSSLRRKLGSDSKTLKKFMKKYLAFPEIIQPKDNLTTEEIMPVVEYLLWDLVDLGLPLKIRVDPPRLGSGGVLIIRDQLMVPKRKSPIDLRATSGSPASTATV